MTRFWLRSTPKAVYISSIALLALSIALTAKPTQAVTISLGQPYCGHLVNGVCFPSQLPGYLVRDEARSYTTPEVVGSLLDAFDKFSEQYPGSCDLFMGDFSQQGGGWLRQHRSHQNGRDVDIGMYARNNMPLDRFVPMNSENMDVPKTWSLVQSILATQRVEHIFLDASIQKLLYGYALAAGVDPSYLDRLFMNAGSGSSDAIIQHVAGHRDHMHVRFFAPWSTLAGEMKKLDPQKQMMIEVAQQSYLPKKVNYYVQGNEPGINALASSFGVKTKDLCRWNGLYGGEVLKPGSCLVFYKRGFEVEPVHLARSLQPHNIAEANSVVLASVTAPSMADVQEPIAKPASYASLRQTRVLAPSKPAAPAAYTVRKGDTLERVAKLNGMKPDELRRLNSMKGKAALKPGQKLILAASAPADSPKCSSTLKKLAALESSSLSAKDKKSSITVMDFPSSGKKGSAVVSPKAEKGVKNAPAAVKSDSAKQTKTAAAKSHVLRKGETLWDVAKKYQISTNDLCRANSLNGKSVLKPGMAIKLPSR
ncbi:MAG: penicillin-insensitive murein endopeptidase [Syntrophobacteraceae bacterium]